MRLILKAVSWDALATNESVCALAGAVAVGSGSCADRRDCCFAGRIGVLGLFPWIEL